MKFDVLIDICNEKLHARRVRSWYVLIRFGAPYIFRNDTKANSRDKILWNFVRSFRIIEPEFAKPIVEIGRFENIEIGMIRWLRIGISVRVEWEDENMQSPSLASENMSQGREVSIKEPSRAVAWATAASSDAPHPSGDISHVSCGC